MKRREALLKVTIGKQKKHSLYNNTKLVSIALQEKVALSMGNFCLIVRESCYLILLKDLNCSQGGSCFPSMLCSAP